MKKYLVILLILGISLIVGNNVLAAGKAYLEFAPAQKEVEVGDVFNVDVIVDPQGESLDTVRSIINYPEDRLEVVYFALKNLFPNVSPGSFIDNTSGLMSQGGTIFKGQTDERGVFGVITFKALAAGDIKINFNEGSKLISSGQEKIDSSKLRSASIKVVESGAIEEESVNRANVVLLDSTSHSDQNSWYAKRNFKINWKMSDNSDPVSEYYIDFDQNPDTDPALMVNKDLSEQLYENVQNGVWYFHIKAKFTYNSYSEISHFRVMIDADDPRRILPISEESVVEQGDPVEIKFGTIDEVSGIDFYEVAIDGGSFEKKASPLELDGLKEGDHQVIVRAVDKAGNVTSNAVNIKVLPKEGSNGNFSLTWWQKLGLILLVLILVIYIIKKKRKNKFRKL